MFFETYGLPEIVGGWANDRGGHHRRRRWSPKEVPVHESAPARRGYRNFPSYRGPESN